MKTKLAARSSLVEQAVDAILDMIRQNALRPGDVLPPQEELMAELGIGRTSLREAVQRLVALGAVDVRSGRRMVVGPMIRSNRYVTAAELEISLRRGVLRDLAEVRDVIEPQAAVLAALRCTNDDILRLESIVAQMHAGDDPVTAFNLNKQFHTAIAEATYNEALRHILQVVSDMLAPLQLQMYERLPQLLEHYSAGDEHLPILNALKEHDPEKAREAMHHHIGVFGNYVASTYGTPSNGLSPFAGPTEAESDA